MNGGDNDMDGDGYINRDWLIDPTGVFYVERIAIAVSNDPFLKRYDDGSPIPEFDTANGGDNDMDGDGITDDADDDMDNDGMKYVYEVEHGVIHDGWQHPFIYNARYAVLIGGRGIGKNKWGKDMNYPAFGNDLKAMYDKLKGYNYLDENIYSFLWDKTDSHGYWVDGPAVWEHTTTIDNYFPGELLIEDGFKRIGENITLNDFFFFAEICHGGGIPDNTNPDNAVFDLCNVYDTSVSSSHYLFGPEKDYNYPNLKEMLDLTVKKYARATFILQSCDASAGIHHLAGENRIIMTAENHAVDAWRNVEGAVGNTFTMTGGVDHWAFIYKGNHKNGLYQDDPKDGFILSLGSSSNANNVLYAFNKGYVAAKENRFDGNLIDAARDYTSHPMLEDYSGNGNTGTQGQLSPSSASDEGWLAKHTYL